MRPPRLDQLDDLDRNLVALLQANARESVADLARQLGVARTTVIARIARLERTNVIAGYSVRLGQDVLDASIYAYVGIIIAPRHGLDVQKRLGKMPEVQLLCAVSGEFDYVAWLRADSPDRLNDLLDEIAASPPIAEKVKRLRAGEKGLVFDHVAESAQPFLTALLARQLKDRLWIVCANVRAQEVFHNELS